MTGVAADNASAFVDEHTQTATGARDADVCVRTYTRMLPNPAPKQLR